VFWFWMVVIWFWMVVIGLILYFVLKGGGGGSSSTSARSSSPSARDTRATTSFRESVGQGAPAGKGFRPSSATGSSSGIRFGSESAGKAPAPFGEQVTDFVTGAVLRTSATTYQCVDCLAYYSPASVDLLSNSGPRAAPVFRKKRGCATR